LLIIKFARFGSGIALVIYVDVLANIPNMPLSLWGHGVFAK
jgi:hypothetical protein